MRIRWLLLAGIAAGAMVPAASRADPAGLDLDTSRTVALGSGCRLGSSDVRILATGDDVALVFTRLALRLPKGSFDSSLSDIQTCAVRVPARLRGGVYLSRVMESLRYDVNKTAGSSGEIDATIGFAAFRPAGIEVFVPSGAKSATGLTAVRTSSFMSPGACSGSARSGLFRANVAITGNRTSTTERLALGAVSRDLRYDLTFTVKECH